MKLSYDRIRDFYLISDPGLFRLRSAIRGTLTVVFATIALYYLSSYGHKPFLLALVGALMAMNGALMGDDRTVREQKVTAILNPLFGAVSTAIGVLALPIRPLAISLLLVFTFAAIYIRRFGPRWNALGGLAYTAYFAALFFRVPVEGMWFVVEGILIAGAFAYAVKFWIVPDRAQSAIAWSLSAYRASLRRFERACRRELQASVTMKVDRESVRPRMVTVNHLALLSEDAVVNAADALPGSAALVRSLQGRVFDLELSARRIFESLDQRLRPEISADLDLLARGARSLRADALIAEEESSVPVPSTSTGVTGATVPGATGIAKVRYVPLGERFHFQTRQAIQATLATAIATWVGTMISADRWYWAPLTAYVIFTGTTRGDSVRRAFARLFGTAFGVAAGLTIAYLLHGDPQWQFAVLFIAMFCAIFSIKTSYGWYVFWLTTVIALFYSLLELLTPSLLYLRIEQTLIGGLIGGLCAFFVLPVSAKKSLRVELSRLFTMLARILRDIESTHLPRRERRVRVRELERELLNIRALAGPLVGPLGRPVREETRIVVHGASALVYYARQLVVFYPEDASSLRERVRSLADRAARLSSWVATEEFVDVARANAGGASGETWTLENPLGHDVADYSVVRLAQSISAFETRFPGKA